MKARLPKGYGRPDPQAMMRQVTVTMTGKHEVTAIKIKPEAVDPDDLEMLEDLIAAAVNSAVAAVDKDSDEEMAKMTGGMNIPGLG